LEELRERKRGPNAKQEAQARMEAFEKAMEGKTAKAYATSRVWKSSDNEILVACFSRRLTPELPQDKQSVSGQNNRYGYKASN